MTHARTTLSLPPERDPIHAAIERHRNAWAAFQVAEEGDASLEAESECDAARAALLGTPCATRFGALALLAHLRWWLPEEAPNAEAYGEAWHVAQARAADLTLFLGTNLPPVAIGTALPCGRLPPQHKPLPAPSRYSRPVPAAPRDECLPGEGMAWAAVAPVRPDTAHVRAPRLLDLAGETFAALAVVAGGAVLTGLATLL